MVEERMRASIVLLGSFWYTAWVNAGQPDLLDVRDLRLPAEEDAPKGINSAKGHVD